MGVDEDGEELAKKLGHDADSADKAGEELGEGYQSGEQAKDDAQDGDQSTADKGKNVADGAGGVLDNAGEALEALGIEDPGLGDAADDLGDFTDDLFGPGAPEVLPPVSLELFFGERSPAEALGKGLLSDGLDVADGLVGSASDAMGISDYVGTDSVSSIAAQHDPFEEDLSALISKWEPSRFACEEGLSEIFRCQVIVQATEIRNPRMEAMYQQDQKPSGLLSQLTAPFESAIALGKHLEKTANDIKDTGEDAVDTVKGAIDDPGGTAEGLFDDALGAAKDMMTSGERSKAEGPVYINVPLDPAIFLGSTCSLRVVRRDEHTRSEHWITGKVVEMEDLGLYRGPTPANFDPKTAQTAPRSLRLVIEPSLGTLALRKDCRVFNDLSALEIVREVFRTAGVYGFLPDLPGVGAVTDFASDLVEEIPLVGGAMSDALSGQYIRMMPPPGVTEDEWTKSRELCVQYNESDLDFVSRLLEEEGIHYCFEQARGFERIVFLHDPVELATVPTVDGRPAPYLWPQWGGSPNKEVIHRITERRTLRTGTVHLRDVCYDHVGWTPTEQTATPVREPEDSGFEDYRYPASFHWRYADRDDDEKPMRYRRDVASGDDPDRDFATLRLDEARTRSRSLTLRSDIIGAGAGRTLKVRGYFFQDKAASEFFGVDSKLSGSTVARAKADHLIVSRVTHVGAVGGQGAPVPASRALPASPREYDNIIEAHWVPRDQPTWLRPFRKTPKPQIHGIQTATVVDSTGSDSDDEAIYRDHPARCRIKIRFHWDRRGELPLGIDLPLVDQGKTGWVRVNQPWGGAGHGAIFVPRVGTEVAISFVDGDPDRPVVLGSLYDGVHPLPLEREGADGSYENVLHTRSSPLGWDERESFVRFVDEPGKEKVGIQAGRYFVKEVRAAHTTRIGGDETLTVNRHDGELIDKKQTLEVTENRKKIVKAREDVLVKGDRTSTIDQDETVETKGKHWQWVEGKAALTVGGARTLEIEGERRADIGREGEPPVTDTHDVKAGTKTDTIKEVLAIRADSLAVGERAGERGGGLTLSTEDDGHTIRMGAKKLKIRAQKEVRIESEEDRIRIEAGDELVLSHGAGPPSLKMDASGIRVQGGPIVELATEAGKVVVEPDVIKIYAEGERSAMIVARANVVRLDAKKVHLRMNGDIEMSSSGPGRVEP